MFSGHRNATNQVGYVNSDDVAPDFKELVFASRLKGGDWYTRERAAALCLAKGESEKVLALFGSLTKRDIERAGEEEARLRAQGFSLLSACCDSYPAQLRQISDPPLLLVVQGELEQWSSQFSRPLIAVVGARKASMTALEFATSISEQLSSSGIGVVSGFARGVDAAAHRGSMLSGEAEFPGIGVLGSGHKRFSPSQNRRLCESFLQSGGLVVSEHLPEEEARAWSFPRRNRIIAGLSSGTIVVEAGERSGSLITARLSLEYGREVFAVPGSATNFGCHGSNRLLAQGAHLLQTLEDLKPHFPSFPWGELEEVGQVASGVERYEELQEIDKKLLLLFSSREVISQDKIIYHFSMLSSADIRSSLFRLESVGLLESLGAGRWRARDL